MEPNLDQIHSQARRELGAAGADSQAIKALQVKYLGRKGVLTQYLRSIAGLPADQRPEAGRLANELKTAPGRGLRRGPRGLRRRRVRTGRGD